MSRFTPRFGNVCPGILVTLVVLSGCSSSGDSADIIDDSVSDSAVVDVAADSNPDGTDRDADITGDSSDIDVMSDSGHDTALFDTSDTSDASDAAETPEYGFSPVPAIVSCQPAADSCAEPERVDGIFASYRKDYFFSKDAYNELLDDPLNGGRFHIVGISAVTGNVTGVEINGVNVGEMLVEPLMEWYHVWPEQVVEGEPLWFAFHSRNPAWDAESATGTIKILTDSGTAMEGIFEAHPGQPPLTHVILSESGDRVFVHLKNTDTVARTVERIVYNGRDVTGAGIACLPETVIEPGAAVMWEIPLCETPDTGSAYTVVVEFQDALPSVAGGRLIRPFFPIEVWPSSSDCALPGHDNGFFDDLAAIGVDTVYYYWGGFDRCGFDRNTMLGQTLPAYGEAYVLLGDDFPFDNPPPDALPDRRNVLGFLTGDESDWAYYDDAGFPKAAKKAADTRAIWRNYPDILTYNGAMTNRHVGTFAGMADVQGIDFYNAACAPHIIEFGQHPPLRGPYDYLKNTRDNHMPWRTWFYSQGTGSWDGHALPHEVMIQAISVMASGAKGLMWFMATREGRDTYPDTWQAMGQANRMFHAVRPYLLQGDITGLARSDDKTVVDAVRAVDAIVVPVITADAEKEMTDEDCAYYSIGLLPDEPHWVLRERTVDVTVTVPDDFSVQELFEVRHDGTDEIAYPILVQGRDVTIRSVPVSDSEPVHLFVFARNSAVRADVDNRIAARLSSRP